MVFIPSSLLGIRRRRREDWGDRSHYRELIRLIFNAGETGISPGYPFPFAWIRNTVVFSISARNRRLCLTGEDASIARIRAMGARIRTHALHTGLHRKHPVQSSQRETGRKFMGKVTEFVTYWGPTTAE